MYSKIAELHSNPLRVVIAATGAGAGCQSLIAAVPGASKTLLDAQFPYSKESLVGFLGRPPIDGFATEKTAMQMARMAYRRALELDFKAGGKGSHLAGLGITCAIATNRVMKGEHRIHAAITTGEKTHVVTILFQKNEDGTSVIGRQKESEYADYVGVNLILLTAGISQISLPMKGVKHENKESDIYPEWKDEITGILVPRKAEISKPLKGEDSIICTNGECKLAHRDDFSQVVFFDGSFNPLHHGHTTTAREVEQLTKKEVIYVITSYHPDKGNVPIEELQQRTQQFSCFAPVMVTRGLSLYIDKAIYFRGASFIVGSDTLERILNPKYYTTTVENMLRDFRTMGTHFFVAPRINESGEVVSIHEVFEKFGIGSEFRKLFTQLSCRVDVSSSAIRARELK